MDSANSQANPVKGPGSAANGPARSEIVASSIVWCVLISAGTDVLVAVMVRLNIWVGDAFPWFIAPALALSLTALRRSRGWYKPLPSAPAPSTGGSLAGAILLGIAVAAASVLSMLLAAHDAFVHGRLALSGDQYQTTAAVRAGVSLAVPIMASFYEEAGVRGALQLHLQHVLGPLRAEILAGTVFVVLHGFVIARNPWQVPFLAFSAFAFGRLAAITQTVGYPVLAHGLSNGLLVVTGVILRGLNR